MTVSSRGNAESVMALLVIATIYTVQVFIHYILHLSSYVYQKLVGIIFTSLEERSHGAMCSFTFLVFKIVFCPYVYFSTEVGMKY